MLINQTDIAEHAGVGRAAVANWRQRHDTFPQPVGDSGLFDAAQIAAWLDGRSIPAPSRAPGEPAGQTYGARFRRKLRLPPAQPTRGKAETTSTAWRLLDRLRGSVPMRESLEIVTSLLYLRAFHGPSWHRLLDDARPSDLIGALWRDAVAAGPASSLPPWLFDRLHLSDAAVRTAVNALLEANPQDAPTGGRRPEADLLATVIDAHSRQAGKTVDHLTPRLITRLVVDLLGPASEVRRIYDPFCRAGEFLGEIVTRLPSPADVEIDAVHPDMTMSSIAYMNLRLHGARPNVCTGMWWDTQPRQRSYDLIVTNPPFNLRLPEHALGRQHWPLGVPSPSNGNASWLQHIASVMAPHGRAAVLMPTGAESSASWLDRTVRQTLVTSGMVESVIAMPAKLLPGTSVPFSIWMLRSESPSRGEVLFIDGTELGQTRQRGPRTLTEDELDKIRGAYTRWRSGEALTENGISRSVEVAEISRNDYAMRPQIYVDSASGRPAQALAPGDLLDDLSSAFAVLNGEVEEFGERLRAAPASRSVSNLQRPATVGDVCELRSGPAGTRTPRSAALTDGVALLLPRHLHAGRIAADDPPYISAEAAAELGDFRVRAGDVLLGRIGGFGNIAVVGLAHEGWLLSTELIRLRPTDEVLAGYLSYFLGSAESQQWLTRNSTGSVLGTITLRTLARLPINLPPLTEQQEVCDLLDALGKLDDAHLQVGRTAADLRASLLQRLL